MFSRRTWNAVFAALPALIAFSPVHARPAAVQTCPNATSTVAIQDCQQALLKAANAELNTTYRQQMAALSPARQAQLRTEERAWMRQRDRICAVRPDAGTSGSLDAGQCLLTQTRERTQMLRSRRR